MHTDEESVLSHPCLSGSIRGKTPMIPNEQLELFRDALLRSLKAARSIGLNLQSIELALMVAGFRHFTRSELEDEIQYFIDAKFIVEVPKSHSFAHKIWRMTKEGIDDLEKRGY